MLKPTNLADFVSGINMLADETSIPRGSCRDAKDIDFDVAGNFSSRKGFTKVGDFSDAHSLWGSRDQSFGLFMNGTELRRLIVQAGQPMSAAVMNSLTPSSRASYFEYDDKVFFTNTHELGFVSRKEARLLGLPDPSDAWGEPSEFGTLPAGKYTMGYSYVLASGEESALSNFFTVELLQQGGIEVIMSSIAAFASGASKIRIYGTPPNGDVMYLMQESAPRMSGSYTVSEPRFGKQADNDHLTRMPAGEIVRVFNGRVVVSQGSTLRFSQPFRFGLTKPSIDWVQFESPIYFFEPVAGGIYVGTREGSVYFLAGGGPGEFSMTVASTNRPVKFGSTLIEPAHLNKKLAEKLDSSCCLWLGANGYSLGLPDGTVTDSQADRITLDEPGSAYTTTLTNRGVRQILSIVESPATPGPGAAIDTMF